MDRKPMTYLSLKAVLQYVNANKRLELANRSSRICRIERLLPLRIDRLAFHHMQVSINDTTYKVGIYQEFPMQTPPIIARFNATGGVHYDVDEFGLRNRDGENDPVPGDIHLKGLPADSLWIDRIVGYEYEFHQEEEPLENQISVLETLHDSWIPALQESEDKVRDFETDELTDDEDMEDTDISGTNDDTYFWDSYPRSTSNRAVFHGMQRFLERIRFKIDCLRAKERNEPVDFTRFLQVTTTSPQRVTFQRRAYDQTLAECFRLLLNQLFNNRKENEEIFVQKLEFNCDWMTIPLPLNLKFKISHLKIDGFLHQIIDAIKPHITDSSFPLDCLEFGYKWIERDDTRHEVTRTATKIIVSNKNIYKEAHDTLRLTNKHLHFRRDKMYFQLEEHLLFILDVVLSERPVNSFITIELEDVETALILCSHIPGLAFAKGTDIDNRIVTINMPGRKDYVQIFYDPAERIEDNVILTMEIKSFEEMRKIEFELDKEAIIVLFKTVIRNISY